MARSSGCNREAHWRTFIQVSGNGAEVSLQLKAWVYRAPEDKVCWEFRRLAMALYQHRKHFKTCKAFASAHADLHEYFEALGGKGVEHCFHSERSEAERVAKGAPAADGALAPYLRAEASLTTEAVVLWLLLESTQRRNKSHKELARTMVHAFVQPWFSPASMQDLDWDEVWGEQAASLCGHDMPGNCCCHVRRPPLPPRSGRDGIADVVSAMVAFASACLVCDAAARALGALLSHAAKWCFEVLPNSSSTDPFKQVPLRGAKRQLRIDEDYRQHVMVELPKHRRILDGSVALACDQTIRDESRARDWMCQRIRSMLHSSWHQLETHGELRGPVSLVEDGSRIGNPGQETIVIGCWLSELQTGLFLPVQVVRRVGKV